MTNFVGQSLQNIAYFYECNLENGDKKQCVKSKCLTKKIRLTSC